MRCMCRGWSKRCGRTDRNAGVATAGGAHQHVVPSGLEAKLGGRVLNIVDAQIHLWAQGLPSNPSHWQVTSFATDEALAMMDAGGVTAAVIHPPSWDPTSAELARAAVRDHPGRFAVMGHVPLEPAAAAQIAAWRDAPGMLGLRYSVLNEPAKTQVADGSLDWLWSAAEAAGVPIALLCTDSLRDLAGIAARHPDLRLTVDHLGGRGGTSPLKGDAAMTHMSELLALAAFPNVAVKATGAPGYADDAYPFRSMHGYLRQIFDAFGPDRMFWGTDISKMPCPWSECVAMFTEELPWLRGDDLRLVMGEAVCAWWGWQRA